jgi:hypothetical protein
MGQNNLAYEDDDELPSVTDLKAVRRRSVPSPSTTRAFSKRSKMFRQFSLGSRICERMNDNNQGSTALAAGKLEIQIVTETTMVLTPADLMKLNTYPRNNSPK